LPRDLEGGGRTLPSRDPSQLANARSACSPILGDSANSVKLSAAFRHSVWGIENGLHWILDMVFRDDECRVRTANFFTIKHIAYNLMRRASRKDSIRLTRKVAAWDDDFLASLIAS